MTIDDEERVDDDQNKTESNMPTEEALEKR